MIDHALDLAATNDNYPKWPVAAVIVKGGRFISRGLSKKRNEPLNVPDGENCSEHAEAAALRRAAEEV